MEVLSRIYLSLCRDKRKERFETILEPLQAITQLALLAFCPKGSKLSIVNNVLFIQTPTWSQGFLRSYNQDQRDDLFFLFSVIRRFNKFYNCPSKSKTNGGAHSKALSNKQYHGTHHSSHKNIDSAHELFSILIELSKSGIDNLIQTYSESDQTTLLHTLRMYRTMLDKPDAFSEDNEQSITTEKDSIDDIFVQITNLYSPVYIDLLNNIFKLAQANPEQYNIYITGVNTLMEPINCQLNKWISDHIVF
tara:strand:+ start:162 stop:908 length:747 start_codon:yes stop_codon:yes gene_type:complete